MIINKKREKRGVSPLIATVLLIGFSVALVITVGAFLLRTAEKTTEQAIDFVEGTSDCNKIVITADFLPSGSQLGYTILNRGYLGIEGVVVRLYYDDRPVEVVVKDFGEGVILKPEETSQQIILTGVNTATLTAVEFIPLRGGNGCSDKKASYIIDSGGSFVYVAELPNSFGGSSSGGGPSHLGGGGGNQGGGGSSGGGSECGNSAVESGEECDDGNTNNGDGCSSSCTVEPGYIGDTIIVTGEIFSGSNPYNLYTVKYDLDGNKLFEVIDDDGGGDGGNNDGAHGVAVDSNGNIIVTGELHNEICYTVKYDPIGNKIWDIKADATGGNDHCWEGNGVAVDSNDNIIVGGRWQGSLSPWPWDNYVAKYDSDGNELWSINWDGGGGAADSINSVAVDSNGNIIVTGYGGNPSNPYTSDKDYLTIKYDPNGNEIWTRRYSSSNPYHKEDIAYDVTVDSDNNIIVVGHDIGIRPDGYWTYKYHIIKYDSNGNELWSADRLEGKYSSARHVTIDSNDNIIVVGVVELDTNSNYFTVKYDSNGNELWAVRADETGSGYGDLVGGVATDSNDNIIVTGSGGTGTKFLTIKYDPNGNKLFERGESGPTSLAHGVIVS